VERKAPDPGERRVRITVLTVPGCPNALAVQARIAAALQ
jgi:hypothetical protein